MTKRCNGSSARKKKEEEEIKDILWLALIEHCMILNVGRKT